MIRPPDVAHLLDVLGRMVVAEHRDIYDADELQDEHGTHRYFVRKDLNKVVPELRRRVVEVRGWLRNNYGAARAKELLEFEGRTPRGFEELADLATIMVRRLPILKPKQGAGGDVDPAKWSEHLRPLLEKTSDLLQQRGFRNDDVEIATKVKGKILVAFDKTYRRVLRLAEIFYLWPGSCGRPRSYGMREDGPRRRSRSTGRRVSPDLPTQKLANIRALTDLPWMRLRRVPTEIPKQKLANIAKFANWPTLDPNHAPNPLRSRRQEPTRRCSAPGRERRSSVPASGLPS